jgi:ubiquinone/menaquinone biosynthesis C-methylase UbiE
MTKEKEFYKNLEPFLDCKDYTVSGEVYQAVKSITLKRKLNLINSFNTSSKNILDVGAGTGDFLKVCKNNSWNVFGTEPSLDARNIATKKGVDLNENVSEFKNQKFNIITLWHVLEHVENLQEYILTLESLLSKNGRLLIAVPNFKSDDANYYKKYWAAFDVPRHLWHFSQSSIPKLFSEVHMIVEKTIPMKFDAYYVSLLSEKYKTGKMKPAKSFYIGFISNWKAKKTKESSSLIYVLKKQEKPF